jgi:hypothetical protein
LALLGPKFVVFIYLSYPLLRCHFSRGVLQHSLMLDIPHPPSGRPQVPPLSYGSSAFITAEDAPAAFWWATGAAIFLLAIPEAFLLHSVAGNAPPTF